MEKSVLVADLSNKKIAVSLLGDVVGFCVMCGDRYEAQIFYDDIIDRLNSGQDISLTVRGASPEVKPR